MLNGTKVIDFGRFIAAPFAAQILADIGASVIKVERIPDGDEARRSKHVPIGDTEVSGEFTAFNRGKRSIAVDLTTPAGHDVITRLVKDSDALIHNFRPGVMERLGFGYDEAHALNSRLVYCSVSAFGQRGPDKGRPGNDLVMQAFSGLMSFSGEPGSAPVRCPVSICDYTAGFHAAIGVLGGLFRRESTGAGAHIEVSLLEGMLALLNYHITDYLVTGHVAEPMGSANLLGQPNQAFKTTDGWVALSAVSDRMWRSAAIGLGLDDMVDDSRFTKIEGRYANRDELIRRVSQAIGLLSTSECLSALANSDANCAPIQDIRSVLENPQLEELDMVRSAMWRGQEVPVVASAITADGQRAGGGGAVPELSEHSEEILRGLGYSRSDVSQLRSSRVVL